MKGQTSLLRTRVLLNDDSSSKSYRRIARQEHTEETREHNLPFSNQDEVRETMHNNAPLALLDNIG
jgi:hypothetical protein